MTTVGELIELLQDYDEDDVIVIGNDDYGHDIGNIVEGRGIRSFHGDDYRALVLKSGRQVGAIWDADDLQLDDEE